MSRKKGNGKMNGRKVKWSEIHTSVYGNSILIAIWLCSCYKALLKMILHIF